MAFNVIIVGGGTAGTMAASYFKSYWGDRVDVTMIYDHSKPGIGVGESLTPIFDQYLKTVGISTIDLIKNCNATIKLGLKFKNWTHEGSEWFHSFPHNESFANVDKTLYSFNAIDAYDILHNQYDSSYTYGKFYFDNNLIPSADNLSYRHALHADATLFSKYIEHVFQDRISVIDGNVIDVVVNDGSIQLIKLENGRTFSADLFIDASGLERVLFKQLDAGWVDLSDQLPTDRAIPFPLFKDFDEIPPYTTAEATKNGWILDVPLSNRHGTGYVYSSKFTADDEALHEFDKWLFENYNVRLTSDRIIKFSSGYNSKHWVGNCVAIGLASGFVEPLEATNIHHVFMQIDMITHTFEGTISKYLIDQYNTKLTNCYENTFEYIRFFYHTNRDDSPFWKYLKDNTPESINNISNLMLTSMLTTFNFKDGDSTMFSANDFNCIAYGHGMFKNTDLEHFLRSHWLYDYAAYTSNQIRNIKQQCEQKSVNHKQWIDAIKRR